MAPAALDWPSAGWDAGPGARFAALAGFAAGYAALALGLRLVPLDELREIARAVRGVPGGAARARRNRAQG